MEEFVTRNEFNEYGKRIDSENTRQNKRIEILEDRVKDINDITVSLTKLTASVEQMVQEQKLQGERLAKIEELPGRNWNNMKSSIITGICTALATAIVAAIIAIMA